ncbi:hypothetical protein COW77_02285 [Candidatus Wolfebacteria bacterium CG18_big_fil_WC_8_21_14_2_50_39_7]|uniref:LTD domain-containing protein n=5 Tax=Candidatus Wolfeibacteriota TaxID=1752735 RepID=A0A2M7Q7T7_9BACT|nr:lamin tail domain-containing protein [Parcubacteria group bacterium]NCO89315.1 lamin tail domain-containing protein [Candidatus Wolfebacteria bacterium]OIO64476.1 MAG: hypothetical protein AUJ30_02415 [Candidatus Wolfebacteria bacterium CG1_02_39_135]PIP92021.1 MAG: hypothetical protein COW77_02285 [Candidatus Wolfebacteria bacterium CG18_big_fil_WC_8_21_14_2_50_39_7]PIU98848.1 MAG: hypothetical protein COS60_00915 [Candidatus Wolfebacteria bacterium CG03_land_8_20_14_0_80_39_317]PIY59182.1
MLINEFFPNPVGKDADGEWIELFNNGQETVNFSGWQIKDASGKTFIFSGQGGSATGGKNQELGPAGYLLLDYKTTKISLNNNGETLFLYDQNGALIDKAEFTGSAPEGKSLIRKNNQFVFTDKPTPAKANIFESAEKAKSPIPQANLNANVIANISSNESSINNTTSLGLNLLIGLSLALILAFLAVIILRKLNLPSD